MDSNKQLDLDFYQTLEALRKTYLSVSQSQSLPPSVLTNVYHWISALKSVECGLTHRRVCLRNQMAIDLLKQLQGRQIEWPFDQGQAQARMAQMMGAIAEGKENGQAEELKANESQRSSFLADVSTSLNTDRFFQRPSRNLCLTQSMTSIHSGFS